MAKEWNRSLGESVGAPPWHVWRASGQGPEPPNVTLTLVTSVTPAFSRTLGQLTSRGDSIYRYLIYTNIEASMLKIKTICLRI